MRSLAVIGLTDIHKQKGLAKKLITLLQAENYRRHQHCYASIVENKQPNMTTEIMQNLLRSIQSAIVAIFAGVQD